MKKTLLLFSIITTFSSFAQDDPIFHWAKSVGGLGFDSSYGVTSDASGNVYTCGSFNSTIDFDPGSGTSNLIQAGSAPDGFIQKLDGQGNFVWAKRFGGNMGNGILAIEVAANGDVIAGGSFFGTVDFDPNSGTTNFTSIPQPNPIYASTDVVVSRLSPEGNLIWAKRIGGPGYEEIKNVTLDAEGNIYVSGFFELTCDFDPGAANYPLTASGSRDAYIFKLDANGNFVWAKRFGGTSDSRINQVVVDAQGNLFAVGVCFGSIDVDPGAATVMLEPSAPLNGYYSQDVFILKLNASGEYQWAGKLGGNMGDECFTLAVDADANIYVAGSFYGNSDMDPGVGETILSTVNIGAVYLCKFNSSGQLQWAKQSGSVLFPEVKKLQVMDDGDIVMMGNYESTFAFFNSMSISSQGENDIFLARLDSDGNAQWIQSFGGAGEESVEDMSITADGIWHVSGSFKGTANMNPFGSTNLAAVGNFDIFTVRLAPEALKTQDFQIDDAWSVYPNPSNGQVSLHFDHALFGSKVSIHTILGQKVSEYEIGQSEINVQLNPGNYVVKAQHGNSSSVKKLIVF